MTGDRLPSCTPDDVQRSDVGPWPDARQAWDLGEPSQDEYRARRRDARRARRLDRWARRYDARNGAPEGWGDV